MVAVTGLVGHAFGSWRSRETAQMWLKDFLPKDIPNIRVMSYGYNSNLIDDTVDENFQEYRQSFVHRLLDARQGDQVGWTSSIVNLWADYTYRIGR